MENNEVIYVPNDPRYHSAADPNVTVIGIKRGGIGFYPIHTPRTYEELNGEPISDEIIAAARSASMWGWHVTDITKPVHDWLDKKYRVGQEMEDLKLRVPKWLGDRLARMSPEEIANVLAKGAKS